MRTHTTRNRRALIGSVAAAGAISTAFTGAAQASAEHHPSSHPMVTTVISGLNTPRGIAFDGDGSMYAVQSGTVGQGPFGLTNSGKVSKYRRGSTTPTWTTTFESLYVEVDPSQPPDVLGPEGISAVGKDCGNGERPRSRPRRQAQLRAQGT